MWLLLIYEIATITVEAMERKVSGYLRRWLGVPPSFTSIGLYSNSIELSLPVSSVVVDLNIAKCRCGTKQITELQELGSRQGQENGLQKHQWTKQRVCYNYEKSLVTQTPGERDRNVSFPAVFKCISRSKAHRGPGRSAPRR